MAIANIGALVLGVVAPSPTIAVSGLSTPLADLSRVEWAGLECTSIEALLIYGDSREWSDALLNEPEPSRPRGLSDAMEQDLINDAINENLDGNPDKHKKGRRDE